MVCRNLGKLKLYEEWEYKGEEFECVQEYKYPAL